LASKGGHRQFKHPTKRGRVTVPDKMSADLDPKTEKSILKQAGLDT
jgi:predicted RNA binding protein YcfA (HicA-like mRNA interferase family)